MNIIASCSIYTEGIENIIGQQYYVGIKEYDYVFVLARCEGKIVGYCLALKLVYEFELINIYVYQGVRRRGVGRQLVETIDNYLLDHYGHYAIKFSEETADIKSTYEFYKHVLNVEKFRKIFHYKLLSSEMNWCFYRRCSPRNPAFSLRHISELSVEDINGYLDLANSYDPKFKELTYVLYYDEIIAGFIIANNIKQETIFILYLNIMPEFRRKGGAYSCIQLFTDRIKDLPQDRRQWLSFYFYADEPKLCKWYRYLFGDLYDKHKEHYIINRYK